jgi:biopolymer transport protein TolR
VEVNLPQADVRPVTSAEDMFIVSIRRDGRVFLEDTEMTIEAFKEGFAQLAEAAGTQRVYLRGDEEAMWGVGVEVVAAIVNAGVGVSLIAEPTPLQRSR